MERCFCGLTFSYVAVLKILKYEDGGFSSSYCPRLARNIMSVHIIVGLFKCIAYLNVFRPSCVNLLTMRGKFPYMRFLTTGQGGNGAMYHNCARGELLLLRLQ